MINNGIRSRSMSSGRDRLIPKKITDSLGHNTVVWVRPDDGRSGGDSVSSSLSDIRVDISSNPVDVQGRTVIKCDANKIIGTTGI